MIHENKSYLRLWPESQEDQEVKPNFYQFVSTHIIEAMPEKFRKFYRDVFVHGKTEAWIAKEMGYYNKRSVQVFKQKFFAVYRALMISEFMIKIPKCLEKQGLGWCVGREALSKCVEDRKASIALNIHVKKFLKMLDCRPTCKQCSDFRVCKKMLNENLDKRLLEILNIKGPHYTPQRNLKFIKKFLRFILDWKTINE